MIIMVINIIIIESATKSIYRIAYKLVIHLATVLEVVCAFFCTEYAHLLCLLDVRTTCVFVFVLNISTNLFIYTRTQFEKENTNADALTICSALRIRNVQPVSAQRVIYDAMSCAALSQQLHSYK